MSRIFELHQQFEMMLGEYTAQGAPAPVAYAVLSFVEALESECVSLRATVEAQGKAIVTLSDRLAELEYSDVDVEI